MKFCHSINFTLLNSLKYVDPSDKMDLEFWDCFGRKNSLSVSYIQRNMVREVSGKREHCDVLSGKTGKT